MVIKIDEKNRINVHRDHYALMKPGMGKRKNEWDEYAWHSSLEFAIKSLAQQELSNSDRLVDFEEFVKKYHKAIDRVTSICEGCL